MTLNKTLFFLLLSIYSLNINSQESLKIMTKTELPENKGYFHRNLLFKDSEKLIYFKIYRHNKRWLKRKNLKKGERFFTISTYDKDLKTIKAIDGKIETENPRLIYNHNGKIYVIQTIHDKQVLMIANIIDIETGLIQKKILHTVNKKEVDGKFSNRSGTVTRFNNQIIFKYNLKNKRYKCLFFDLDSNKQDEWVKKNEDYDFRAFSSIVNKFIKNKDNETEFLEIAEDIKYKSNKISLSKTNKKNTYIKTYNLKHKGNLKKVFTRNDSVFIFLTNYVEYQRNVFQKKKKEQFNGYSLLILDSSLNLISENHIPIENSFLKFLKIENTYFTKNNEIIISGEHYSYSRSTTKDGLVYPPNWEYGSVYTFKMKLNGDLIWSNHIKKYQSINKYSKKYTLGSSTFFNENNNRIYHFLNYNKIKNTAKGKEYRNKGKGEQYFIVNSYDFNNENKKTSTIKKYNIKDFKISPNYYTYFKDGLIFIGEQDEDNLFYKVGKMTIN